MSSESTTIRDRTEGMGWRVSVSIVTFFGAIVALIVWLFFYANSFSAYQNAAIVIVIFLAFVAIMGGTWAPWGMRQSDRWAPKGSQTVSEV